MRPSVPLLLASGYADGTSITNSTTPASCLHGSGKAVLAGGAMDVGTTIKAFLHGSMGVGAAGAGNIGFDMRIGGTVVTNYGNVLLRTNSCSTLEFFAELNFKATDTSTAAGGRGSMRAEGIALIGATVASTPNQISLLPTTQPATSANNWDQTANGTLDIFATWTVATSGNILLIRSSEIWLMN